MIANQIISQDLSQDSNVNVVAPVAPVSNINDVPKKMSRKRTSKAETEQKMKRQHHLQCQSIEETYI